MKIPCGITFLEAIGLGLISLVLGCQKQASDSSLPTHAVAMVGDQVIPRQAFEQELARRTWSAPGKTEDLNQKQALLEEMIRFEVLYQKARAAGYDQDPQICASLKRMMVARFREDQAAKLGEPSVTAEEVARYYQSHLDQFCTPARLRAALIEIKVPRTATPENRTRIRQKVEAVLTEAKTNPSPDHTFGLLAQQYSEHQPSRYRGGDIGWMTVGDTNSAWNPAVLESAFELAAPGEISPVIETSTAFYILKLTESQPAAVRSLEKVKDGVAYALARQKAQQQEEEFYAALRQGMEIRTNLTLLASIPPPASDTEPPGVPGDTTASTTK